MDLTLYARIGTVPLIMTAALALLKSQDVDETVLVQCLEYVLTYSTKRLARCLFWYLWSPLNDITEMLLHYKQQLRHVASLFFID